jgi:hypothetical protein
LDQNDSAIERRLRQYRPAGPSDSLRERCLTPPREVRVWPWATAAAALLAIAFGLQIVSARAVTSADLAAGPASRDSAAVMAALGDAVGDGAAARPLTELIVVEELQRSLDPEATARPGGGPR